MTTAQPTVCVVMAAMNAQDLIGRAVKSALIQRYVTEVIVVDDASTDATTDAARAADDGSGRLSVFTLPRNRGPASARNYALSVSNAEYFCVLDSDDYLMPGRVERLIAQGGDDWDMLADDIYIVPSELAQDPVDPEQFENQKPGWTVSLTEFVIRNISIPRRPRAELGFLKPIIRRAFLDQAGIRYEDDMRLGEDYALYLEALRAGARFKVVGGCGYVAVERSNSLSSTHNADDLARVESIDNWHIENPAGLTAEELTALKAHKHHTKCKYHYAQALEIKQGSGFWAGVARAFSAPETVPYMVGATWRARMDALREKLGVSARVPGKRQPRLLIGD